MEYIKELIRFITTAIALIIYICIWGNLIKNWSSYTASWFSPKQSSAELFYNIWLFVHGIAVLGIIAWAWSPE